MKYVDPFWKIVRYDARKGNRHAIALLKMKKGGLLK